MEHKNSKVLIIVWGQGEDKYKHLTPYVNGIIIDANYDYLETHKVKLDKLKGLRTNKLYVSMIIEVEQKKLAFNKFMFYNCISITKLFTGIKGVFINPKEFVDKAILEGGKIIWELKRH